LPIFRAIKQNEGSPSGRPLSQFNPMHWPLTPAILIFPNRPKSPPPKTAIAPIGQVGDCPDIEPNSVPKRFRRGRSHPFGLASFGTTHAADKLSLGLWLLLAFLAIGSAYTFYSLAISPSESTIYGREFRKECRERAMMLPDARFRRACYRMSSRA
jgi:hypothetical protein